MKKIIYVILLSSFFSCQNSTDSDNSKEPRNVKYIFSGTIFSGTERVSFIIEHNGNLEQKEPWHSYPYITEEYNLQKGDRVYVFAQNVSLISSSTIRIDLVVDSDTIKTASDSGEVPSAQIIEVLQ